MEELPEEIKPMSLPTLGTMVSPMYKQIHSVVPIKYLQNEDINLTSSLLVPYSLGFTKPYFKDDQENLVSQADKKFEVEYLEGIKAGLGPLRNVNQNLTTPTNLEFTTKPMVNLDLARNSVSYIYSNSWTGNNIKESRSDYQTRMGREILTLEAPIRAIRLY